MSVQNLVSLKLHILHCYSSVKSHIKISETKRHISQSARETNKQTTWNSTHQTNGTKNISNPIGSQQSIHPFLFRQMSNYRKWKNIARNASHPFIELLGNLRPSSDQNPFSLCIVVMIEKGFQHFKQMFPVKQNNATEPIISLFVSLMVWWWSWRMWSDLSSSCRWTCDSRKLPQREHNLN